MIAESVICRYTRVLITRRSDRNKTQNRNSSVPAPRDTIDTIPRQRVSSTIGYAAEKMSGCHRRPLIKASRLIGSVDEPESSQRKWDLHESVVLM